MTRGTILVTGAAGFAGAHLLNLLSRADSERTIEGWARPSDDANGTQPGVRWRNVELLDAESVSRAIAEAQPSEVYHLAGAPHVAASWQQATGPLEIHVRGTHHLLEAIRTHAPACRVLVVSSGMIYRGQDEPVDEQAPFGPASPYALSKLAEDQLALHVAIHDGLDVIVARPFTHIGPGQSPAFSASSFAHQIAEIESGAVPPVISVGNLESSRDLTDVRDVVAAYVALMRAGRAGTAYNVCRGEPIRISALLDQLLALSHSRVEVVADPERLRPNDVPFLAGRSDRLRADTGWSPAIPLRQTLTDLLDYWRQSLARQH